MSASIPTYLNEVQFPKELRQRRESMGTAAGVRLNEVQFPKELRRV